MTVGRAEESAQQGDRGLAALLPAPGAVEHLGDTLGQVVDETAECDHLTHDRLECLGPPSVVDLEGFATLTRQALVVGVELDLPVAPTDDDAGVARHGLEPARADEPVAVTNGAGADQGHHPVAPPPLGGQQQGRGQDATRDRVGQSPTTRPVGSDTRRRELLLEDADVGIRYRMEDADPIERHTVLDQPDHLAHDVAHLFVRIRHRDDLRSEGHLGKIDGGGEIEACDAERATHLGVGLGNTRQPDDHARLRDAQRRSQETGQRRRRRAREVPDDRAMGGHCLGQVRAVGGRSGEVGLGVETLQPTDDVAVDFDDRGGEPAGVDDRVETSSRDVGQLADCRGHRLFGGLMVAHWAEVPWALGQRAADCGPEHRIGEGPPSPEPTDCDEFGQPERGEEAHVGESGTTEGAAGQQPAGGQAGEVGGHDHRDRCQRAGALGRCDGTSQRLARRATVAGDDEIGHDAKRRTRL